MRTVEFFNEHGYMRDMEEQLRSIAKGGQRVDSIALQSANQIKHLKSVLKDLIYIVEIHQDATGSNFAWAELPEAMKAIPDIDGELEK